MTLLERPRRSAWEGPIQVGPLLAALVVSFSGRAAADVEPRPAPFVLPRLSHRGAELQIDGFLGRHASRDGQRVDSFAAIARASAEVSVLVPHRLFVGLTYPFASAVPPDGGLAPGELAPSAGRRTLPGNAEGHVRAVFPLPTGLEIGFALAAVAPTGTFDADHRADRSAALAASSLDPSNAIHFLPGKIGLRAAGDLGIARGPLVLQGRHGFDVIIDPSGVERAKLAGRLVGHLGLLVRSDLEVSIEASQIYWFASDDKVTGTPSVEKAFAERYRITDGRRTALTIGPGVRYATSRFDLGACIVTSLTDPLSPASGGFMALRVSVAAHLDSPR